MVLGRNKAREKKELKKRETKKQRERKERVEREKERERERERESEGRRGRKWKNREGEKEMTDGEWKRVGWSNIEIDREGGAQLYQLRIYHKLS